VIQVDATETPITDQKRHAEHRPQLQIRDALRGAEVTLAGVLAVQADLLLEALTHDGARHLLTRSAHRLTVETPRDLDTEVGVIPFAKNDESPLGAEQLDRLVEQKHEEIGMVLRRGQRPIEFEDRCEPLSIALGDAATQLRQKVSKAL
jgi:hypothetical protein